MTDFATAEKLFAQLTEADKEYEQAEKNCHAAARRMSEANENLVRCQNEFNNEMERQPDVQGEK